MKSLNSIDHTTRLYRAFHEAGHCAAAFITCADVEFLELFAEGGGRCRVLRSDDRNQARFIAAAGYAVEFILHRTSRLVASGNVKLSDKEFINLSMANAWDDKKAFFGGDYSQGEEAWPAEMDEEFMTFGWTDVSIRLQRWMPAIEVIAGRLETESILSGEDARKVFELHGL